MTLGWKLSQDPKLMDTVSKQDRSRIMAQVKGSGNKSTELVFIRLLCERSIRGWRRNYPLFGNPDFTFPAYRVAVFIDGCFWHACPQHCRMPATNREYWQQKISRNAKRDLSVSKELKRRNWTVIRFWEHDLKGGRGLSQKMSRLKRCVRPKPQANADKLRR